MLQLKTGSRRGMLRTCDKSYEREKEMMNVKELKSKGLDHQLEVEESRGGNGSVQEPQFLGWMADWME